MLILKYMLASPHRFLAIDLTALQQIKLGTRGSSLALAQTQLVVANLQDKNLSTAVEIIKTSGDMVTCKPLYDIGGKGLFAKEIEQALMECKIDLAVHSLKDLESHIHPNLVIAAVLKREAAYDVLLSKRGFTFATLPINARIGTCSPRRQAFLKFHRPDLEIVPIRGNVESRIEKMEGLNLDAIILAAAGLNRLHLNQWRCEDFTTDFMIPAVGQGAIAVQCRSDDTQMRDILKLINCTQTWECISAERQMLAELGGSCRTPIAGYAEINSAGQIELRGMLADDEGKRLVYARAQGNEATTVGCQVATQLKMKLKSHE